MKSIGAYEAKTHLPQLLDEVASGETVLITRRGLPVALLTRPPQRAGQDARDVIAQMKRLRRGNTLGKRLTIRHLIEDGRRS